jgi:hypothetical protein
MSEHAASRTSWSFRLDAVLVASAYAVLVAVMLATRFLGLGHSFWFDELHFVAHFVREGPGEILAGPDLSHELMAILCWATRSVVGESELAFRLWSVVPFVAGVAVVTAWLHKRIDPVSGVLFLFLATISPLLLDITRQARGYGLAFFAMCVLVVAALDAARDGRTGAVVAMCAAGVIGTWTLPQLGIGFITTGAAVALDRRVRRPTVVGLAISVLAIAAWYTPHLGQVRSASQIHDGLQISSMWLVTAPIDQVLIPALIWIDGTAAVSGVVWLPFVAMAVVVMASSPLARDRRSLLVLCAGLIATILVLWIARAYVIPRYVSFLLVPLFVLLASGASAIFSRIGTRPAIVRTLICVILLGVLALRFATIAPDVVRLPREANRDAAELIDRRASRTTPVVAYVRRPENLSFYLGRPVRGLNGDSPVASVVCGVHGPAVYVTQPFALEPVRVPCLGRPGVLHFRFEQYARGGEMNVWFVPPGRGERGS